MVTTLTGFRESQYLSGQGVLFLGSKDGTTGEPTGLLPVGNVSALTIGVEVTNFEHKESQTGVRAIDLTLIQEISATLTATFESIDRDNLALATYGTGAAVSAGTASDEVVKAPASLTVGSWVKLANIRISSLVVGNDATPTTTYQLGKNYEVDEEHGMVFIYSTADQTAKGAAVNITAGQDLFMDYSFGAHQSIQGLTSGSAPIRWARFAGLNTAESDFPVVVDIFKAAIQPLAELALIQDEIAQMEVEMQIQSDATRVAGSKFFRVLQQES